jgi:hypothetical protein
MTCKCTTQLCAACLDKLLEEHRKVRVEPASGLDKLKIDLAGIWTRKEQQEEILAAICDFYCDAMRSKKAWFFLGFHPKPTLMDNTEPSIWLHDNQIKIEAHSHGKFLKSHDMPFYI